MQARTHSFRFVIQQAISCTFRARQSPPPPPLYRSENRRTPLAVRAAWLDAVHPTRQWQRRRQTAARAIALRYRTRAAGLRLRSRENAPAYRTVREIIRPRMAGSRPRTTLQLEWLRRASRKTVEVSANTIQNHALLRMCRGLLVVLRGH